MGVVRALLARGADVTAAHVSQWQAVGSEYGVWNLEREGRPGQARAVKAEEGSVM